MAWQAFGEALPQALAIGLSPIPIVLVILVLVSPRARTSGPAFAAGWFIGVLGLTGLVFTVAVRAGEVSESDSTSGNSVVQLLLGLVFAAMAVSQWRKRPKPGVEQKSPKILEAIDTMPPLKVFGVGLGSATANPKNLPLAISAGVAIAQFSTTTSQGRWAVLLFSITASAVVLGAVAAVLVAGERVNPFLDSLKAWLLANGSTIMLVIFILLAAKMFGSGLALGG